MPFVELTPPPQGEPRTGVRVSIGKQGVRIALARIALEALGGPVDGAACKVWHDADLAKPMVRVATHAEGEFILKRPNGRGSAMLVLRLRHLLGPPTGTDDKKHDCNWARCASPRVDNAIDIALPVRHVSKETQIAARASGVGALAPRIDTRPSPPPPPREGPGRNGRRT